LPLNLSAKCAAKPNGRADVGLKKPVSISGMDGSVSHDIQVAQNKKAKARASGVGILAPCFSADACLVKAPQRDLGSVGAL